MAGSRVTQEPPRAKVILEKVVKPGVNSDGAAGRTLLGDGDKLLASYYYSRGWGFVDGRVDAAALEAALEATVTDLPFLAGRLAQAPDEGLHIAHTSEGATLIVAECEEAGTDVMAPCNWQASGFTWINPPVPFYFDKMDVARALQGAEALFKVRLTRMTDGDILALTINHAFSDATYTPLIATHLAARYREAVSGEKPKPDDLLQNLADRRLLSSKDLATQLGVQGIWAAPVEPATVQMSMGGTCNFAKGIVKFFWSRYDDMIIHIPEQQMADLQRLAADGNRVPGITTGDAVQAACTLLCHVAHDKPLVPVAPAEMNTYVMLPIKPPGYFGNAVCEVPVSLEQGTQQPPTGDYVGALRLLAGSIRSATATFRAEPEKMLERLRAIEASAKLPFIKSLYNYAQQRAATCTVNYLPKHPKRQSWPDLGLGEPYYDQESLPKARGGNVVVRPATGPYPDGLLVQLMLKPEQAARLKDSPILQQLLPLASMVGRPGYRCF